MINIDKNLFLNRADNITVVTSGKRSSGKTWLSLTLAHALNLRGQQVLIVEADNGMLNADFQLSSRTGYYLNDVVSGECTLNQAIRPLKKKFDMITAKAGSDLLENMPLGRLQLLGEDLCFVAKNYDQVILDVSNDGKVLHNLLPNGSNIVLLCDSNPSSLVSAYKFLQNEMKILRYNKLQIVVNYAHSYEEGLRTYNTLRHACEMYVKWTPKLLGVVRRDTRVRDAIRNHALLLNRYPNSEAAEDIIQIADKIIKGETIDETTL